MIETLLPPPVRNKQEMYRRLKAGDFGNTVPSWNDVEEWYLSEDRLKYKLWGIRSRSAADRALRLDVPTSLVANYARNNFKSGYQISPMVDPYLVFRGELYDSPEGLRLFGVLGKPALKWREALARFGQEWRGLRLPSMLEAILWPSDHEDMRVLLASYPNHVIEFTACSRPVGLVPHRNTVIWEVRIADGSYEKWR